MTTVYEQYTKIVPDPTQRELNKVGILCARVYRKLFKVKVVPRKKQKEKEHWSDWKLKVNQYPDEFDKEINVIINICLAPANKDKEVKELTGIIFEFLDIKKPEPIVLAPIPAKIEPTPEPEIEIIEGLGKRKRPRIKK